MIALKISEVKVFMQKLLVQEVFDYFYLKEASLLNYAAFEINGRRNKAFYTAQEFEESKSPEYIFWSEIRPFFYQLVKGKKLPLSFHVVLMLPKELENGLVNQAGGSLRAEDVSGCYLNLRYENNQLTVITGVGLNTFTMDKSLEYAWEKEVKSIFKAQEIAAEEQ